MRQRRWRRWLGEAAVLALLAALTGLLVGRPGFLAGLSPPGSRSAAPAGPALTAPNALRVLGNRMVDLAGRTVIFHGVNYSGAEYACARGFGIFDGPSDAAMAHAIAAWHANSVRLLLNEDCWLGINGVDPAYSGPAYRQAIVDFVRSLHAQGLYVELSLAWAAPGPQRALGQAPMPDADHAPAFWRSVAATFIHDPFVVLGAYGEPHEVSWSCWLRGGAACRLNYEAVGMQQIVDTIRATGATQPIAVSGIDFANDLSQWLEDQPHDPRHQLVAEFHLYGNNLCNTPACWARDEVPVLQHVPLLTGELGESYDDSRCEASFISKYMAWADAHGVGYQAWTWNTWGTCSSLISRFDGTPAGTYGQAYRDHLAVLARPAPSRR
jgi:endoglucanase